VVSKSSQLEGFDTLTCCRVCMLRLQTRRQQMAMVQCECLPRANDPLIHLSNRISSIQKENGVEL